MVLPPVRAHPAQTGTLGKVLLAGLVTSKAAALLGAAPAAASSRERDAGSVPRLASVSTSWSTCWGQNTNGLRTDARLWCWGSNGAGELGRGGREDRLVPVRVR